MLDLLFFQWGFEIVDKLLVVVGQFDNCCVLIVVIVFVWYDEGILGVVWEGEFWVLKLWCIIVVVGSYENLMVFENNDLLGIFLVGGLQCLMYGDFIWFGSWVVVVVYDDWGYVFVQQLLDVGVVVVVVIDKWLLEQVLVFEVV